MKKLLFVEPSEGFKTAVETYLASRFVIEAVSTLSEARQLVETKAYDLALLEATLPDGDALAFCGELRASAHHASVPIVFLGDPTPLDMRLSAFSAGADDFIVMPCELAELRARLEARLRRREPDFENLSPTGDIRLDLQAHSAWIRQEEESEHRLKLTPTEFKLLAVFVANERRLFSREELLSTAWGGSTDITVRTIDTHVSNLRKKMAASNYAIQSVHGRGYRYTRRT